MNDIIHEYLNKLRLISKIHENQKLSTIGGLSIYSHSFSSWLIRKWMGDNKEDTVRIIRDIYKSFKKNLELLIQEYHETKLEERKYYIIYQMINTVKELRASINGLDNLSRTYDEYPETTAALEGIIRDYVIITITILLNIIPKEKWSSEFTEDIFYRNMIIFSVDKKID